MTYGAKWGSVPDVYNTADRLYGLDGANPGGAVQWIFLVDWGNDGTFAYNESAYMVDMDTNRGERFYIQPGGQGFERIRPGEGNITLESIDGRFDPDDSGSPLHDKLMPGRKFRLMVKDLTTGTTHNVMAGFISDIPPISESNTVQLAIRESLALLDRNTTSPTDYYDTVTNNLGDILNTAGFPAVYGSTLDTESLPITSLDVDNVNALDTLQEIAEACLGQLFADNTGKVKFYSLAHNSWTTIDIDQADCRKAIRRSSPWENVRNRIQVTANKKMMDRESVIWENASPIAVAAYTSKTINVKYGAAINPWLYSWKANMQADGKGTQPALTMVNITGSKRSSSWDLYLNNGLASTVYFTSIVITGHPIVDKPLMSTASDSTSISTYGEMVLDLDSKWLQDHTHAEAYAALLLAHLKAPQRTIEIQIDQRPDLQFSFDIMDKIHFQSAKLAIDETLHVGRIEHRWQAATGQDVRTTLVMRPRLTSTDAIGVDPRDPDLPYIPPTGGGGGGGGGGGSDNPPGGSCLTDLAAAANGPYRLPGIPDITGMNIRLDSNGTTTYTLRYDGSWIIRGAGVTNPTYAQVFGEWVYWDAAQGKWFGETSATNWRMKINDITGEIQTITDNGSGMRTVHFHPGGIETLNSVTFEVDAGGGIGGSGYSPGDAISSGTYGADVTGAMITVNVGQLYCVESSDGPIYDLGYPPANRPRYPLQMYTAAGGTGTYMGYVGTDAGGNPYVDYRADAVYAEMQTDNLHGRMYFMATQANYWVFYYDYINQIPPTNLSGTMTYTLRQAYYNTYHRMTITGVNIGNICTI